MTPAPLHSDLAWITELDADAFLDALETLDDDACTLDALHLRCRDDLAMFGAVFCGERLPLPYNAFHRDVLARPKVAWTERTRPQRIADAAPRGNAKSTIESYISLIHDAVYGLEAFVGIISTTYSLSEDLVADLHAALTEAELHPELHECYGPFICIGGKTDFVVHVPGQDARGTRFAAYSFGGSIRGSKHAGIRFTKIVIDDGEHPEKVRSPAQRLKTWDYLTKDIIKAGDRYTVFRIIGTVLHPDSLLNRVIGAAVGGYGLGWTGKRWQSVITWPERTHLWALCRDLWSDLTDPDREETARGYYERHRVAMDRGAQVLWPEKEGLFDLHIMLWTDGAASFNSEKQNEATDPERQVFYPERWRRCTFDGLTVTTSKGRLVPLSSCKLAVWLDPRASLNVEKNDYAALAIVARDPHGYVYILACDMRRDDTTQQLDRVWGAFDMHHTRAVYGYEDNGFQVMMSKEFDRIRAERRDANRAINCHLQGHTSTQNKMDRISGLAPRLDNGWIEVCDDVPHEVAEQFRQIPSGSHDDGPDAIERAIWLVEGGGVASATLGTG
jgi:hypothetical protein